MLCWCLAVFLLCCPAPLDGRPAAPSSRLKRSVTHAQLMHDKGRALQDFKRRMWLQELLDEVHTAEIRELAVRTTSGGGGGGGGSSTSASTTGSTLHSKPPGGTKNLPLGFGAVDEREVEEAEEPNLPQETHKSQPFREEVRAAGKRRKKSRSGRRREGDKKRRRARSLPWSLGDEPGSGLHLEWRSLLGLQRAVL